VLPPSLDFAINAALFFVLPSFGLLMNET